MSIYRKRLRDTCKGVRHLTCLRVQHVAKVDLWHSRTALTQVSEVTWKSFPAVETKQDIARLDPGDRSGRNAGLGKEEPPQTVRPILHAVPDRRDAKKILL